jgi:hypothetical protein
MAHPSNPEAHPDGIEISKLVPFSLKSSVVYCNFWDFSGLPIYVCLAGTSKSISNGC